MSQHILRQPSKYWRTTRWLEAAALVAIVGICVWLFVTDDSGNGASDKAPLNFKGPH